MSHENGQDGSAFRMGKGKSSQLLDQRKGPSGLIKTFLREGVRQPLGPNPVPSWSPRCTRSVPLHVIRPPPMCTHFVWLVKDWKSMESDLFFLRSSGKAKELLQTQRIWVTTRCQVLTASAWQTFLQVEVTKGEETALCYPVVGSGHFGWCTVEGEVETRSKVHREVWLLLK